MSYLEQSSSFSSASVICDLSVEEIELVGGGLSQYGIDWKKVAEVLRQYSNASHAAAEAGSGAATLAAMGALAQLGLDVPNDVAAAALGIAAGGSEAISYATSLLADWAGS